VCPAPEAADKSGGVDISGSIGSVAGDIIGGDKIGLDAKEVGRQITEAQRLFSEQLVALTAQIGTTALPRKIVLVSLEGPEPARWPWQVCRWSVLSVCVYIIFIKFLFDGISVIDGTFFYFVLFISVVAIVLFLSLGSKPWEGVSRVYKTVNLVVSGEYNDIIAAWERALVAVKANIKSIDVQDGRIFAKKRFSWWGFGGEKITISVSATDKTTIKPRLRLINCYPLRFMTLVGIHSSFTVL
jgi:hypothetical protein